MHHVDVGSYRDCQWTGRAVIDVLGQNDDMRISRLGAMTAMPKNLFSQAQRRRFVNIFRSMEANEAEWRQGSVCVMYEVNTVPPKPILPPDDDSDLAARVALKRDSLASFHPKDLLPINCGSNDGLLTLLRNMRQEEKKKASDDRFIKVVVADVNLFKRMMKVTYGLIQ